MTTYRFMAVASLLLAISGVTAAAADTRPPNSLERAYTAMVQDGYSALLCDKISTKALSKGLFNSPGTQIFYERSACYFYAAATELNDSYCPQVVEADAWFLNGAFFSAQGCREFIVQGRPWRASVGFDHEALLRAAGYTEKEVKAAVPDADQEFVWMSFYHSFHRKSDGSLQQRLDRLPDFSRD